MDYLGVGGFAPCLCFGIYRLVRAIFRFSGAAYNSIYYLSIQIAPFEVLYSRHCQSLDGWFEIFKDRPCGLDLLYESLDWVWVILDRLQIPYRTQKSNVDHRFCALKCRVG